MSVRPDAAEEQQSPRSPSRIKSKKRNSLKSAQEAAFVQNENESKDSRPTMTEARTTSSRGWTNLRQRLAQGELPKSNEFVESAQVGSVPTSESFVFLKPDEKDNLTELVNETTQSGWCSCSGSIASRSKGGGLPVLSRRSCIYGTWTVLLLPAVVLMNVLTTPVGLAFVEEYDAATLTVLFFGDAIMILDILLQFNTSLWDNVNMELITDRRALSRRYMGKVSKFPLHCAASFPVDVICLLAGSTPRVFFGVRLLRCLRLANLYSAVTEYVTARAANHIIGWEQKPQLAMNVLRYLKLMVSWIIVVHTVACIWHAVSLANSEEPNSWFGVYAATYVQDVGSMTKFDRYVTCLYWAMTTMSTIGYGDIIPITSAEKLLVIGTIFLGVNMYAGIFGAISGLYMRSKQASWHYSDKLTSISRFMKRNKLPEFLQGRIFSYYGFMWMKSSGVDDNMVLADLPIQLRTEVRLQLYQGLIESVPIFDSASVGFLVSLVMKLKAQVCMPGDALIHQGEIGSEMYVVKSGRLVAFVVEDDDDDSDSESVQVFEEKNSSDAGAAGAGKGSGGGGGGGGGGGSGGGTSSSGSIGSANGRRGQRRGSRRRQSLSVINPDSFHEDLGSFKKTKEDDQADAASQSEAASSTNEREIGYLCAGDYFGELALLFRRARTASVVTCTYSEVLILAAFDYEKVARVFADDAEAVMKRAMRLKHSSNADRRPSLEAYLSIPKDRDAAQGTRKGSGDDLVQSVRPGSLTSDEHSRTTGADQRGSGVFKGADQRGSGVFKGALKRKQSAIVQIKQSESLKRKGSKISLTSMATGSLIGAETAVPPGALDGSMTFGVNRRESQAGLLLDQ